MDGAIIKDGKRASVVHVRMTISPTTSPVSAHITRNSIRSPLPIFPTPLYRPRFVFDRGSRTTERRRPRGGRSDRRDLRPRRVRGSTDPEDPQDAPLRSLVRVRVAPPRLLPHHPLGRGVRR